MKKVVLPLAVISLVAAGATVGSVKYSADQAHAGLLGFVADFNKSPQNKGVMSAELRAERGFADGRYQLDITVQDPEAKAVLGLDRIPLDITMKGGFLSATLETQLAPSQLLTVLQKGVGDTSKAPIRLLTEARYSLTDQVVVSDTSLLTEKLLFEQPEGRLEIAASETHMKQQGNEIESVGTLSQISVTGKDGVVVKLNGLKVDQQYTMKPGSTFFNGMTSAFDVQAKMQSMHVQEPGLEQPFVFNDLSFTARQKEQLPRVSFDLVYGMGEVSNEGVAHPRMNVNKAAMDLTLDFDSKAVQSFYEQVNALPPEQRENPFILMGMMNGLTSGGIGLQINQLDLQTKEGDLTAEGQVTMAGFELTRTMQDPNSLLRKTNAKLNFKADGPLLDALLKPAQIRQLQGLTAQGLVHYKKGQYSSDLKIDNGHIVVNGVPLS